MSVTIPISINLDFYTPGSIQKVYEVLADVPHSVSHFPNVEQLVDLGNDKYRWEMEKMGAQKYYFQVKYVSKYSRSETEKWVRWVPVDEGNASFAGVWKLSEEGTGTRVHFENEGHIELPFPRIAKRLIKPFVLNKFQELFDKYIENLKKTFSE